MALPYLDNPATLDEMTVQELDGLVAKLNTFLGQQHTAQGGHGDITATSVVVDGPVTVRDEQGNPSTFARTRVEGTSIYIKPRPDNTNPYLTVSSGIPTNPKLPLVRLGIVGSTAAGRGAGVELTGAPGSAVPTWAIVNTALSAGFAWLVVDVTNGQRPLLIVNTAGHYEVRPETFGPEVWLGTNDTANKRFARGYIDAVYEQGRSVAMGDWQTVPYNAANFTASTGTWGVDAGDVLTQRFTLLGQTLCYTVRLSTTSVSATPSELIIALPAGYQVATAFVAPIIGSDAGTNQPGACVGVPGEAVLHLLRLGGLTWATTVNATYVFLTITFEVTG